MPAAAHADGRPPRTGDRALQGGAGFMSPGTKPARAISQAPAAASIASMPVRRVGSITGRIGGMVGRESVERAGLFGRPVPFRSMPPTTQNTEGTFRGGPESLLLRFHPEHGSRSHPSRHEREVLMRRTTYYLFQSATAPGLTASPAIRTARTLSNDVLWTLERQIARRSLGRWMSIKLS